VIEKLYLGLDPSIESTHDGFFKKRDCSHEVELLPAHYPSVKYTTVPSTHVQLPLPNNGEHSWH